MPGYVIHLAEGRRIVSLLETKYRKKLTEEWKNLFYLGCLLPDTKRGANKRGSHFWDPATWENLKKRPDLERFKAAYGETDRDPRMLGYLAHLMLDVWYVNTVWDHRMCFLGDDGTEKERFDEICAVRLPGHGEPIPLKSFLSDEWLYGDYTKLNARITEEYGVRIPVFREEEWTAFRIREVEASELRSVLQELQGLLEVGTTEMEKEVRVLTMEAVREMIEAGAQEAAAEIAKRMNDGRPVDLHSHTCCSDGSLTPTELVELAAEKGLSALAVTDHDTMDGVAEAVEAGNRLGVRIIPGMEFSTMEEGKDVHMVGLFLDPEDPVLKECMASIVERRWIRNQKMAKRLMDAGLGLTQEDVDSLGTGIWTRGNLAGLLTDKGIVSSVKEGMAKYLSPGTVGYEPKVAISPEEAIRIVHEAGGLVFVAHYYQIDKKDLANSRRICEKILKAGADGLETLYCEYDDEMRRESEEMAVKYGCLRSGGSDFHGKIKPGLELGTGYGDLSVPESYLRAMEERLGIHS